MGDLILIIRDIIYHNQRTGLTKPIEEFQYKFVLLVSGCWLGTSREILYEDLGWESLSEGWSRRLTTFYIIKNGLAPYLSYHSEIIISRHNNNFFPITSLSNEL